MGKDKIIDYVSSFEEQGYQYLIIEYAEGGDLAKYIEDRVKLKLPRCQGIQEILVIITQVISSLDFLHNLQILHRDITPQNVFVINKETLHVKLADLGIALSGELVGKDLDISMHTTTALRGPGENVDRALINNFNVDTKNMYGKKSDVYYVGRVLEKLV